MSTAGANPTTAAIYNYVQQWRCTYVVPRLECFYKEQENVYAKKLQAYRCVVRVYNAGVVTHYHGMESGVI
jgi:hypothetical protein